MFNFIEFNKKNNGKFTVVWKAVQCGIKKLSKTEILEVDIEDLCNILISLCNSTNDTQCRRYYSLISVSIVKIQKAKADLLLNDVRKLEEDIIDVEEIRQQKKMPPPASIRKPTASGVRNIIEPGVQHREDVPDWVFNLDQPLFEDHIRNIEIDLQERLVDRERNKAMLTMEEDVILTTIPRDELEAPILDQQELVDIFGDIHPQPRIEDVQPEVMDVPQEEVVPVQQEPIPQEQEEVAQTHVEEVPEPIEIRPTKRRKTDKIRTKVRARRIHVLQLINRSGINGEGEPINETFENIPETVIDEIIRAPLMTVFRDIVEFMDERIRRIESRVTSGLQSGLHLDTPSIAHERTPSIIGRRTPISKTSIIEQPIEMEQIEEILPPQPLLTTNIHDLRQNQLADKIFNLQDGEFLTLEQMANDPICRYTKALAFSDIIEIIYNLPAIVVNYENSTAFKYVQRIIFK